MSTIGERVKTTRTQRGMHQAELARRLGCSVNALSLLEKNAITDPRASRIIGIAKVLQVSADYLLGLAPAPLEKAPPTPVPEQRTAYVHVGPPEEATRAEKPIAPRQRTRKTTPVA